ncbi:MAG: hypothetical protein R3318_04145 [Gammaproteobacteria bacterium]|nr:hypothetical protein [Gammaproteobacteria bacterium]
MTEYDRATGVLTLTLEDAHNYHRSADRKLDDYPPMEFYANKLREFGYDIISVEDDKLEVKAPEHEIVEILIGQHIYL